MAPIQVLEVPNPAGSGTVPPRSPVPSIQRRSSAFIPTSLPPNDEKPDTNSGRAAHATGRTLFPPRLFATRSASELPVTGLQPLPAATRNTVSRPHPDSRSQVNGLEQSVIRVPKPFVSHFWRSPGHTSAHSPNQRSAYPVFSPQSIEGERCSKRLTRVEGPNNLFSKPETLAAAGGSFPEPGFYHVSRRVPSEIVISTICII